MSRSYKSNTVYIKDSTLKREHQKHESSKKQKKTSCNLNDSYESKYTGLARLYDENDW